MSLAIKGGMHRSGHAQGIAWGAIASAIPTVAGAIGSIFGGGGGGGVTGQPGANQPVSAPNMPVAQAGMPMPNTGCKVAGYHLNKSSYARRDDNGNLVWIPKGTVWIKNRRRNPLNKHANSRAMSRLTSAKKAAEHLNRVTIRKPKRK